MADISPEKAWRRFNSVPGHLQHATLFLFGKSQVARYFVDRATVACIRRKHQLSYVLDQRLLRSGQVPAGTVDQRLLEPEDGIGDVLADSADRVLCPHRPVGFDRGFDLPDFVLQVFQPGRDGADLARSFDGLYECRSSAQSSRRLDPQSLDPKRYWRGRPDGSRSGGIEIPLSGSASALHSAVSN
jgi:hypothetical protein